MKQKKKLKKELKDYIIIPVAYCVIIIGIIAGLLSLSPISVVAAANVFVANNLPTFSYNLEYEEYVPYSSIKQYETGDQYGTIKIEAAELDMPLCYGDDAVTLKTNIGTYEGGGLPGMGIPVLVAGHNGTTFKQLRYAEIGDIVEIDTDYGTYTYEIIKIFISEVSDWDSDILKSDEELLIMYTCYPFDQLNVSRRYFVYARYVSGPRVIGE